ncbi:MAG TPA: hypothetical protein VFS10_14465 [Pyrinomonadaceae bacterium]|nr:hypothetical protein [Pyrinomonadaceae bacterium]
MSGRRANVKRNGARLLRLAAVAFFTACAFVSTQRTVAAQCPTMDKPINKRIRFAPGRTSTTVRDTIRLCTSHEFFLRARAGQRMTVRLVTGRKTSFTIYTTNMRLSDGVKNWTGELEETGEYQISIGTDATARYTLEVSVK